MSVFRIAISITSSKDSSFDRRNPFYGEYLIFIHDNEYLVPVCSVVMRIHECYNHTIISLHHGCTPGDGLNNPYCFR